MRPAAVWAMEMIPQPRVETLPIAQPVSSATDDANK
jgi:hypothetical protein